MIFHGGKIGAIGSACKLRVIREDSEGRIVFLGLDVDLALFFLCKFRGTLNIRAV